MIALVFGLEASGTTMTGRWSSAKNRNDGIAGASNSSSTGAAKAAAALELGLAGTEIGSTV